MRTTKNRILILFVLLCIVFFVSLTWGCGMGQQNIKMVAKGDNKEPLGAKEIFGATGIQENNIHISFTRNRFSINETIDVTFFVKSDISVADYNYTQVGFEVLSIRLDNQKIEAELAVRSMQIGSLTFLLRVVMTSRECLVAKLFVEITEQGVFISALSEDDAYEQYLSFALENHIIDKSQYETRRNERYKRGIHESYERLATIKAEDLEEKEKVPVLSEENFVKQGVNSLAGRDTYVQGKTIWKDDDGNEHPLRGCKVEIYSDNKLSIKRLGTVYTNAFGEYSFVFQNSISILGKGYDVFVKIFAGDSNIEIRTDNWGDYCYTSSVRKNVATGSTLIWNMTVDMTTDFGRACQIAQAAFTARNFAQEISGTCPSNITIRYPTDRDSCWYDTDNKQIFITSKQRENSSSPHSYASWDVVMHEYGHHVANEMHIDDSPGGSHTFWDNLALKLGNKESGIKLAWSEAWATIFGAIAQDYYSAQLTGIKTVADTRYTSYNGLDFDFENCYISKGEACEGSLLAVLWDLYDRENDLYDETTLSAGEFWDMTTCGQPKTFSDFYNDFWKMYPSMSHRMGKNLSYYNIASSMPVLQNKSLLSDTIKPHILWDANGGGEQYANDSFSLHFYVESWVEIPYYSIENIQTTDYTLTQEEWDNVRSINGNIYFVVAAQHTVTPATGPYRSGFVSFLNSAILNPVISANPDSINNGRYYEHIGDIDRGRGYDYRIKFTTPGKRILQTFGRKNVELALYDSAKNEVGRDSDSGYEKNAFINYSFVADREYIVRIWFMNPTDFGNYKFVIFPGDYGNTFDSINTLDCSYGMTLDGALAANRVKVFTLSARNLTYVMRTGYPKDRIDLCLYLIDPSSTDPISTDMSAVNIFNDDGEGDLQAKIEKTLSSSIPYILIISAYNPASVFGDYSFSMETVT